MADTFGAMPPQIEMHYGGQENAAPRNVSEDCLYLNIWTPAKSGDDRLGVMVWYHGGGYQTGSAVDLIFDGQRLAEKGIIIVTVGYRLGVLGYYCHPDMERESPYGTAGNFGLMDQAFALGWVHRNIASFGGDPEKITIAGQSAGAASVCNLMCSPLASGLFRQAICQSGDGLMRMEMEYARALKLENSSLTRWATEVSVPCEIFRLQIWSEATSTRPGRLPAPCLPRLQIMWCSGPWRKLYSTGRSTLGSP